jgi:hypothetical protein
MQFAEGFDAQCYITDTSWYVLVRKIKSAKSNQLLDDALDEIPNVKRDSHCRTSRVASLLATVGEP